MAATPLLSDTLGLLMSYFLTSFLIWIKLVDISGHTGGSLQLELFIITYICIHCIGLHHRFRRKNR